MREINFNPISFSSPAVTPEQYHVHYSSNNTLKERTEWWGYCARFGIGCPHRPAECNVNSSRILQRFLLSTNIPNGEDDNCSRKPQPWRIAVAVIITVFQSFHLNEPVSADQASYSCGATRLVWLRLWVPDCSSTHYLVSSKRGRRSFPLAQTFIRDRNAALGMLAERLLVASNRQKLSSILLSNCPSSAFKQMYHFALQVSYRYPIESQSCIRPDRLIGSCSITSLFAIILCTLQQIVRLLIYFLLGKPPRFPSSKIDASINSEWWNFLSAPG